MNVSLIDKLIECFQKKKELARDDYRELAEISLGRDADNKFEIQPPGAMYQARWMARVIYPLKLSLLKVKFRICNKDKADQIDVFPFSVDLSLNFGCNVFKQ